MFINECCTRISETRFRDYISTHQFCDQHLVLVAINLGTLEIRSHAEKLLASFVDRGHLLKHLVFFGFDKVTYNNGVLAIHPDIEKPVLDIQTGYLLFSNLGDISLSVLYSWTKRCVNFAFKSVLIIN